MILLLVGEAPTLNGEMSDVTVISPATATLKCPMNLGDPTADIKWYDIQLIIFGSKYL